MVGFRVKDLRGTKTLVVKALPEAVAEDLCGV